MCAPQAGLPFRLLEQANRPTKLAFRLVRVAAFGANVCTWPISWISQLDEQVESRSR
jgi:hypothetical protein